MPTLSRPKRKARPRKSNRSPLFQFRKTKRNRTSGRIPNLPPQPNPVKAVPSPTPAGKKSTVSIAPPVEEKTPSAVTPPNSPASEEKQADAIPSGRIQPGAEPSNESNEPAGNVEKPEPVEQPEPPRTGRKTCPPQPRYPEKPAKHPAYELLRPQP